MYIFHSLTTWGTSPSPTAPVYKHPWIETHLLWLIHLPGNSVSQAPASTVLWASSFFSGFSNGQRLKTICLIMVTQVLYIVRRASQWHYSSHEEELHTFKSVITIQPIPAISNYSPIPKTEFTITSCGRLSDKI